VSLLKKAPRLRSSAFVGLPVVSLRARCPKCGNIQLRVFKQRDYVEDFSHNPLRLIQRLFGARLYYCELCRLQFYDLRPGARQGRWA
jgi:hypothetical protein